MEDNGFNDASAADFDAWRRELEASGISGAEAWPQAQGRLTQSVPQYDCVALEDRYDLPVAAPAGSGLPEAEALERRWYSVLLDYPFTPEYRLPWAVVMNCRASSLAEGRAALEPEMADYVGRWMEVGFSPELYALLHSQIWNAVERAERAVRGQEEREQWLRERLEQLHLARRKLGVYGENLQPEHWRDLPALICRLRPSLAIQKIILLGG